jgi:ParB family chromosome partitioning protein
MVTAIRTETADEGLVHWPIEDLKPNPLNPRGEFPESEVLELAASIKAQGVLQPLLVTPLGLVVAGHRRLAAARLAGLAIVPVTVRDLSPTEQLTIMVAENVQRKNLTPAQEASAYKRLCDEGLSNNEIARRIGVGPSHVANRLAIARFDPDVQVLFGRGLACDMVPLLAKVGDRQRTRHLAARIVSQRLTQAQVRQIIERTETPPTDAPKPSALKSLNGKPKDIRSKAQFKGRDYIEAVRARSATIATKALADLAEDVCKWCGHEAFPVVCQDCTMVRLLSGVHRHNG